MSEFEIPNKKKTSWRLKMQNGGCAGYASDASNATVEAHPRSEYDTENSSRDTSGDSETETDSSGADDDDDVVQCVSCYRVYCRQSWYDWPVVAGHERECAPCVAELLSDAPTVETVQTVQE